MFAFPSCMKKLPEHSALGRGVRAAKNIHPRDQTRAGCFNRRLVRLRSEGGVGGQLRLFQVCIDFYSRFKFSEMCLFLFLFLQAFFKVGHIFFFPRSCDGKQRCALTHLLVFPLGASGGFLRMKRRAERPNARVTISCSGS